MKRTAQVGDLVRRFHKALHDEVEINKRWALAIQAGDRAGSLAEAADQIRELDRLRKRAALIRSNAGKAITAALLQAEDVAW